MNDELIEVGDCVSVSSEDPTTALFLARSVCLRFSEGVLSGSRVTLTRLCEGYGLLGCYTPSWKIRL